MAIGYMELDHKVYLDSICRAVLIGCYLQPPPPPTPCIWAHKRERYWSAKIDGISL
jgi:hypothetical protein